jgi:hypothetical protein
LWAKQLVRVATAARKGGWGYLEGFPKRPVRVVRFPERAARPSAKEWLKRSVRIADAIRSGWQCYCPVRRVKVIRKGYGHYLEWMALTLSEEEVALSERQVKLLMRDVWWARNG